MEKNEEGLLKKLNVGCLMGKEEKTGLWVQRDGKIKGNNIFFRDDKW